MAKYILIIGDDQQANAELAALFEQSTLCISGIIANDLNGGFIQAGRECPEFDIVFLNIVDQATVSMDCDKQLMRLNSRTAPVVLISQTEITSMPLKTLAAQCIEILRRKDLSPALLRCVTAYVTANHQLRDELSESKLRYNAVLDGIAEGVIVCGADGKIESMNLMAEELFGYPKTTVLTKNLTELLNAGDQRRVAHYIRNYRHADASAPERFSGEVEGVRADGSRFPMELLISGMRLLGREVFACVARDATLNKQKEEELQLTATAFETHTAILITNVNGTILRVNPAFTQITGYSAEEALGNNPKMLQSGHHGKDFYERFWYSITTTGKWEGEIWNKRKNGEIYPEWQAITAIKNHAGEVTHYVATFQDITERKQTQALIEHHAFFDVLTNLPNRRMMLDRLNQELSAARRRQVYGALLFLDLDHFKTLNDSMGHAVGDSLLQQMARRLTNHVRTEDTVSRLGGDEFVVLLTNLDKNEKSATATANSIAKKIHGAVSRPYQLEGHTLNFSCSIGVTLFSFASESADDVLKHADTAMYRAKSKGRNAICFYQSSMQKEADQRLRLEKELHVAISNNELLLYYQPQFNNQGELVGAEALLRWNHPKRGIVEPRDFIALAEETNLIQPMGAWVMKTAVKQYVDWLSSGLFSGSEYISVNVSARQIQQDDFVAVVAGILAMHEIPPHCLKLELTESMLLYDLHDIIAKMNQLKELGVSFSMDDFGTGFSSLSYLKRLPFDQIKIDKTFVRDVSHDPNDAAIVETIIAMAEHLKLDVIAEGVETREEYEFLQRKGCANYQGFYFGVPLQARSFEQTIRQFQNKGHPLAGAN
ncbi:MAG: EAL domain-containing protein [Gammaproteobacteria bacterium]|nr:EAL domain-containing protein [Gammaproteobacteria bacterium]